MGSRKSCLHGGETKDNSNCTNPGRDGYPVQCVGVWAKDKHNYLWRYIDASRAARQKFLKTPSWGGDPAGAGYIELYAGPGAARIRSNGEIIDGSPVAAAKYSRAPFTQLLFADKELESIAALKARLNGDPRVETFCDDCNGAIDDMVRLLPPSGLNLAFVDPFGLKPLSFETLGKLASVKRMDMLIHFPTMDVRRNFKQDYARVASFLTRFLGTDTWKSRVHKANPVPLILLLIEQLGQFGYIQNRVRVAAIKTKGKELYHLFLASKDPLALDLWESILDIDPKGQLGFKNI